MLKLDFQISKYRKNPYTIHHIYLLLILVLLQFDKGLRRPLEEVVGLVSLSLMISQSVCVRDHHRPGNYRSSVSV